jgi:hypothetical protein
MPEEIEAPPEMHHESALVITCCGHRETPVERVASNVELAALANIYAVS